MIFYLGSLVQFSPAVGRAGRCRQMSLCVGSTRRVLAGQPAVLAASPRVLRAFSLRTVIFDAFDKTVSGDVFFNQEAHCI